MGRCYPARPDYPSELCFAVLFGGPAFRGFACGERGVDAFGSLSGYPSAPDVGVAVQPPERGRVGVGVRVLRAPPYDCLVDVDVEVPLSQHIDDIGRSRRQVGVDRNQDGGVFIGASLRGEPALVAVRRLFQSEPGRAEGRGRWCPTGSPATALGARMRRTGRRSALRRRRG